MLIELTHITETFTGRLFILFAGFAFIQLLFYIFVFARVAFVKDNKPTPKKWPPLTVIICARNEEQNLSVNLSSILTQDYPNYEVVVVNDCSEDDTDMVLANYKKEFSHLKVTSISPDRKFQHGKKLAVTVGIKAASTEWVVFTDADCAAVSPKWLQCMARNFNEDTQIVLGYSNYNRSVSLLNHYMRYDTFFIALQYMGYALAGNPYMGVGRNMAYRKSLFFQSKGFARHYHILSGDDDLFVNENANKHNTCIETHPESIIRTEEKLGIKNFFTQKMRHYTTYHLYKFKHKLLLGSEYFTRLGFYALLAYFLTIPQYLYSALLVFAIRFIVQFTIFATAQTKLNEKYIWFTAPFFDVISMFINFTIDLSKRFRRGRGKWQ